MPNNSYLRSTKRERQLVNEFRAKGYHAARSAGSHSPWDVWAFNPKNGDVILIQVKTKKGSKVMVKRHEMKYTGNIYTATYSWE